MTKVLRWQLGWKSILRLLVKSHTFSVSVHTSKGAHWGGKVDDGSAIYQGIYAFDGQR